MFQQKVRNGEDGIREKNCVTYPNSHTYSPQHLQ